MTEKTIVWRGAEELRSHLVPRSSISQHPDNPKEHDLGAIAASLARFGQVVPVLVQRSTGWIIAGNGRWEAVPMVGELERTLGVGPGDDWTHVAAVFVDFDDLTAKAYAIADNRTHDLGGGYNDEKLAKLLSELSASGSLVGVGYDQEDVDGLLASLRPMIPTDVATPADPELGADVRIEILCSRVFADEISAVLATWGGRDGVEVSIS